MKIFKELNKLGYKHYTEHTVEELDDLPLDSEEKIMEQALVLRWFREKYNSHHSITRLPQGALDADNKNNKVLKKYAWFISKDDLNPTIPNDGSGKCDTYEEAELACLVKLIEIVKQK